MGMFVPTCATAARVATSAPTMAEANTARVQSRSTSASGRESAIHSSSASTLVIAHHRELVLATLSFVDDLTARGSRADDDRVARAGRGHVEPGIRDLREPLGGVLTARAANG